MGNGNYMSDYRKGKTNGSANQRSDSNKRRMGAAAAAYHANAAGFDSSSLTGAKNGIGTDSLMEQLGSPEMLLKELQSAKRDI